MLKPLLSIAMIFRNDIRCIERCMKALQPLREAAPCELVMADTGSTDGSREIAEKYADILIDFPWIDDFAAARNAALDRCSGTWCLILDTDEYLDEHINELVEFLAVSDQCTEPIVMVTVRNYNTYDMEGDYSDFTAGRIVRMSTGVRYVGAIHEHFNFDPNGVNAHLLPNTILHHDGYAVFQPGNEAGKAKTDRNVRMVKKSLEDAPDNLVLHLQLIEAGSNSDMPGYVDEIRKAIQLVREKRRAWEEVGPPILRYAVYEAEKKQLPEWDEWLSMAEEWFPNSMFTRLDVEYAAFVHDWNKESNPGPALLRGKRYLKALNDYRNGEDFLAQAYSPLQMATPFSECTIKLHMINGYCTLDQQAEAFALIEGLDYSLLNEDQMGKLVSALQDVHFKSTFDTAPIILRLWDLVSDPEQPQKKTGPWKSILRKVASRTFLRKNREAEQSKERFVRHAYTLYVPLKERCEVGIAAAVMEARDRDDMEELLRGVEDWNAFSIHALMHALESGVPFPLPGKRLYIEDMDRLAARLTKDKEHFFPVALQSAQQADPREEQSLLWARGLLLAAVRAFDWDDKDANTEQGLSIADAFACIESEFLPRCYAPQALQAEGLGMLPPMHRFGWYCAQAFEAIERGEFSECVRLLQQGLCVYPDAAKMVEFLLDRVAEREHSSRIAVAPPELLALAQQVNTVLARFAPDDPAVAELKHSAAYQQVAWIIESPSRPAFVSGVQ